jgi:hypothetical protein
VRGDVPYDESGSFNMANPNPKIEELLTQFSESRAKLTEYMADVDAIRLKVDGIFPTTQDFRNRFVLEEKIKAASSFYSTLLNIRQEFNKTIKEEIEIRRKLENNDIEEGEVDVRAVADQVEQMLKEKELPPNQPQ